MNRVNVIFLILTVLLLTSLLAFGWEVALTVYVVMGFTFSVVFRVGGVDKCLGSR